MAYRNYDTGEIISDIEAEDYIGDEMNALNKDETLLGYDENGRYTLDQLFSFNRKIKEKALADFDKYCRKEGEKAFLKNWQKIDEED